MAIIRQVDKDKNTAVLTYGGNPIAPTLNLSDPKQIFDALSQALERAYIKLRDAGIDPLGK